jgi:aspartate aminotransferase-like enzyme
MSGGSLFTPGPVTVEPAIAALGAEPMEYHRTPEFSATVLRCERGLREAADAGPDDRALILTASGTAAMEACVTHLVDPARGAVVIEGGDFGRRFTEMCAFHGIGARQVRVAPGRSVTAAELASAPAAGAGALLVNHHETSTGALHDLELLGRHCRRHGLLFIVDAIGSFLADPLSFRDLGIDALIFSSQKALALPPGLSFVVLSRRAIDQLGHRRAGSYYFDFGRHLRDLERGQTPFTPAVGIIRQLARRLDQIGARGASAIVADTARRAARFRTGLAGLPYTLFAARPSNAVTALAPTDGRTPAEHVAALRRRGFTVCPNGGELGRRIFRVGHLGALTDDDHDRLLAAMAPACRRPEPSLSLLTP